MHYVKKIDFDPKTLHGNASFLDVGSADPEQLALWNSLPPVQKIMLSMDGSFTLLLQAITGENIVAKIISQEIVYSANETVLEELQIEEGEPLFYRTILLKTAETQKTLIYAESFIAANRLPKEMYDALLNTNTPIGLLIRYYEIDTFRRVRNWGTSLHLPARKYLNQPDLIYRNYLISTDAKPFAMISEHFPCALGKM